MTFSFNISNIFKESPPGGRSTPNSTESQPGKVVTMQPVADSDPGAEDAGTGNSSKLTFLGVVCSFLFSCISRVS